jgi:DNA topoisomerase-1
VLQANEPVSRAADVHEAAQRLSLVHVSDEEPGLSRRSSRRGFLYVDANGRKLSEGRTVERIRALAIPPAWTDVWISPDPDGHIQATGRDAKGRKQYRYHERWAACRDEVKYGSLTEFAHALPKLRAAIDADLRRKSLAFERVAAAVVWLLDNTMIRVGNASYARENGSFGLTTLRDRHVDISGSSLRFSFKGKSGKEWRLKLTDRRIARVVKGAQDIPGQHLFQYFDDDGSRRPIRSTDINTYIRETTGVSFTSKHFRTWGATVAAATVLAGTALPETQAGVKRALNQAIDEVAAHLGNTRTVCRNCYIHPAVIEDWSEGRLSEGLLDARKSFRKLADGMSETEMTVLRWLERRTA